MNFSHGKKSRIEIDAPSSAGFAWFIQRLAAKSDYSESLEVRHSGRCGHCGRHLTTPESIDTGFGPECSAKLGLHHGKGGAAPFNVEEFITGGNAYLTLTSKRTNTSFTYRISVCKDKSDLFFVSVLNGPDNWENYQYLGTLSLKPAPVVAKPQPVQNPVVMPVLDDIVKRFTSNDGEYHVS